jgi:hypothetical protein
MLTDVPAVSSAFFLFLFPDGKSKIKTGRLYWEFPKNNFLPDVRSWDMPKVMIGG